MTIKDILEIKPNKEQKLALAEVLNLSIPEISLNKDRKITKKEYKRYKTTIKKLKEGLPLQYITKKAYFYGKEYYVNKNVLIPRPETESLVEKTNNLIKKHLKTKKIKILDIGTGSGIIAITLYNLNNNYRITATDISRKALKIAKKNQKLHKTCIEFIKTDLFKGINNKYDVIISNPPYIENGSNEIEQKVLKHEPHIALFGGETGLDYYVEILKDIKRIIKKKHIIAFEIGERQGNKIKKIVKEYLPDDRVIVEKDYNNHDRYIYIISK